MMEKLILELCAKLPLRSKIAFLMPKDVEIFTNLPPDMEYVVISNEANVIQNANECGIMTVFANPEKPLLQIKSNDFDAIFLMHNNIEYIVNKIQLISEMNRISKRVYFNTVNHYKFIKRIAICLTGNMLSKQDLLSHRTLLSYKNVFDIIKMTGFYYDSIIPVKGKNFYICDINRLDFLSSMLSDEFIWCRNGLEIKIKSAKRIVNLAQP